MGRWAQRRRGRGGGAGPATFIVITAATRPTNFSAELQYSATVNAGDFAAADFDSEPDTGASPTVIVQTSPSVLTLTFAVDISLDGGIHYSGTVPNIESPQDIAYT